MEYLEEHYPEHYDQRVLRTLQRRVKQWKALNGPDQDVIFRQQAAIAQQGFSDFTHPDSPITIQGTPLKHLLYQFRLAYSGWRSVTVVKAMLLLLAGYSEPCNRPVAARLSTAPTA